MADVEKVKSFFTKVGDRLFKCHLCDDPNKTIKGSHSNKEKHLLAIHKSEAADCNLVPNKKVKVSDSGPSQSSQQSQDLQEQRMLPVEKVVKLTVNVNEVCNCLDYM